jgi:bifunctional DNA-binding transcriptional regulator/antitoxin component of YhaV-PrlF toxin-antitoxin module
MNAAVATLSSKYQISLPKTVRECNHWRAGQEFAFLPKGRCVLVMPVAGLDELVGLARGAKTAECATVLSGFKVWPHRLPKNAKSGRLIPPRRCAQPSCT